MAHIYCIYPNIICPQKSLIYLQKSLIYLQKSLIYLQKRPDQDPYIHIYAQREVQGGEDP